MPKIQLRRGLEVNLPTLNESEPGFTTDTEKLFIGSASGNVEIAKKEHLDLVEATVDGHTQTLNNQAQTLNDIKVTNANAEVQGARGTFPLLEDRLNNVDSSLADLAIHVTKYSGTDTQKLQSAIDYVNSIGGGTVLIPKNTALTIDMVNMKSNVRLTGGGTLKFANNTTFFALLLLDHVENVIIDGIVFDGNGINQTTWSQYRHAIISYGSQHVTIKDCLFKNLISDGVYLSHGGSDLDQSTDFQIHHNRFIGDNTNRNGISIIHAKDIFINHNYFYKMARNDQPGAIDMEPNNSNEIIENISISNNIIIGDFSATSTTYLQHGISIVNQGNGTIQNININGNILKGLFRYAIGLYGDSSNSNKTNAIVSHNQIDSSVNYASSCGIAISLGEYEINDNKINSTADYGIRTLGGRFKITNNHIKNSKMYGIEENGATNDFGMINNNKIEDCGTSASNTYGGIHLTGSYLSIQNNRITTNDGVNKTRMGIYLTAGVKNFISGNYFRGIGYRDININIAPQVFGHNAFGNPAANVASGTYPPTSETWSAGEFLIMPVTGNMYVCTASGTPGTWKTVTMS